jgi:hypothetical protein
MAYDEYLMKMNDENKAIIEEMTRINNEKEYTIAQLIKNKSKQKMIYPTLNEQKNR